MAICKPRDWNLSIGIGIGNGIGTDVTSAIISRGLRRIKSANPSISLVLSFFVKKSFISNVKEAIEMQRKACAPQK